MGGLPAKGRALTPPASPPCGLNSACPTPWPRQVTVHSKAWLPRPGRASDPALGHGDPGPSLAPAGLSGQAPGDPSVLPTEQCRRARRGHLGLSLRAAARTATPGWGGWCPPGSPCPDLSPSPSPSSPPTPPRRPVTPSVGLLRALPQYIQAQGLLAGRTHLPARRLIPS